jgi:hypothetical protein
VKFESRRAASDIGPCRAVVAPRRRSTTRRADRRHRKALISPEVASARRATAIRRRRGDGLRLQRDGNVVLDRAAFTGWTRADPKDRGQRVTAG